MRKEVFVKGQGVPADLEIDNKEDKAVHFLIKKDGKLIATCRVRVLSDFAKLERVAVKSKYRGQGIGSLLINQVEDFVNQQNIKQIKIHAQVQAKEFYQRNGYQLVSTEEFIEDGIKHLKMNKKL